MTYLLDTNAVSVFVNGRSEPLRERIRAVAPSEIVLCSVVWAELFYGIAKSQNPVRNLARVRSFADMLSSFPSSAWERPWERSFAPHGGGCPPVGVASIPPELRETTFRRQVRAQTEFGYEEQTQRPM